MDFCRNVTVSGEYHKQQEQAPPASTLDDLFSAQDTEVDVSLEWLSVFVEDCLSSTGNCLPLPSQNLHQTSNNHATTPPPPPTKPTFQQQQQKPQQNPSPPSFKKFPVPVKARSKRNRVITNAKNRRFNPLLTSWSYNSRLNLHSSDPPLLHQTHWLADSELIISPQKQEIEVKFVTRFEDEQEINAAARLGLMSSSNGNDNDKDKDKDNDSSTGQQQQQQPRRCTHCHSQRTPQWRAGPLGPKTLCNACGVRYKSGRLLPEYRPAKSPTFSTYLHSNSHKKVLEMRNMVSSTTTATTTSTATSTSTTTSPTPSTRIPLIPSHNE